MLQGSAEVIDISAAVVIAATQTYSGSAKTPAVTVTLNGETIPSAGYDVVYSNNVNAGTANITVTGKGNYTGTATGTFTINKATGSVSFSTNSVSKYDVESTYTQTVSKTGDGSLSYFSSNTSVATVNSSGKVTFKSTGTVTITATLSAGTNYTGASTYYTLTITALAAATTFDLALSQWELYNSDSTTRYYRSTNHGHSSSDTMTLTAVSAGSITLDVRSYAESGWDYVIVKHNNTQILSTINSQSSSTYTRVYCNVSAGDTITLTYRKDGSVSSGDDTGYLKLALSYLAAPVYTTPTAKSGLSYTGSAQVLLNAGSVTHGTIYYSSDGTIWSTSIPTATTAGSYTSYWKIVAANDSSYDKASASISTTIAKASRSLSFPYLISVMVPGSSVANPAIPSAGNGEGTITYSSGTTSKATVNSSTGEVTGVASGTSVITASMSAGTNYAAASATYTMTVTTEINNFAYTGSVQSVSLPASIYQLQVWGAQGGSNAAYSTYGITAKAGGKGGYSTGIVKIPSAKTVYAFVGGKGSSSGNGGWNGGGGGTGTSNAGSESTATYGLGYSKCGGGGGATDIALTTSSMSYSSYRNSRTSASLLSRMIVAGGGSGGAMSYNKVGTSRSVSMTASKSNKYISSTGSVVSDDYYMITAPISMAAGETLTGNIVAGAGICVLATTNSSGSSYTPITTVNSYNKHSISYTASSACYVAICYLQSGTTNNNKYKLCIESLLSSRSDYTTSTIQSPEWTKVFVDKDDKIIAGFKVNGSYNEYITYTNYGSSTATIGSATTSTTSQVGYVGGGENGGGYSSTYQGRQTAYGTNGAFGLGANQGGNVTSYRYCAGAGGGGWYGGGSSYSNTVKNGTKYSGGGSGFVNILANASSRPSGYTGLQLDQGTTYAGNTTFESTSGSTETGHSGNGYARIKWLSPLDAISDIVYAKLDPGNIEYSSITNPEWKHVLVDSEDKILAGIRKDGTIYISEYIQNL